MVELILLGCFTAFLLAIVGPLVDVLSMFISAVVLNAVSSIIFSAIGTWLVEVSTTKGFILHTVAGAFLGSAFLALAERTATYKPAVINSARPE